MNLSELSVVKEYLQFKDFIFNEQSEELNAKLEEVREYEQELENFEYDLMNVGELETYVEDILDELKELLDENRILDEFQKNGQLEMTEDLNRITEQLKHKIDFQKEAVSEFIEEKIQECIEEIDKSIERGQEIFKAGSEIDEYSDDISNYEISSSSMFECFRSIYNALEQINDKMSSIESQWLDAVDPRRQCPGMTIEEVIPNYTYVSCEQSLEIASKIFEKLLNECKITAQDLLVFCDENLQEDLTNIKNNILKYSVNYLDLTEIYEEYSEITLSESEFLSKVDELISKFPNLEKNKILMNLFVNSSFSFFESSKFSSKQNAELVEVLKNNEVARDKIIHLIKNHLDAEYTFDELMMYLKKSEKKNLLNI